jgi:hypothetical protein
VAFSRSFVTLVVVVVVVVPDVPAVPAVPAVPVVPVVVVDAVALVAALLSLLMFASTKEPGASPARRHPVTVTVLALSLSDCVEADALGDVLGVCADKPTAKAAARHVHGIARFIGILLKRLSGSARPLRLQKPGQHFDSASPSTADVRGYG